MTEETIECLRSARASDRDAAERMVTENSGLIWSVARRYFGRGVDSEDLYQLGCVGFLKAIEGYDESFGTQVSTYAVPMIIGEIRRYLRDNNAIRVSRSLRDIAYKSLSARDRLQAELGREPTVQEIARKLELSAEDVTLALEAIQDPVSLCEPIGGEGADALTIGDQVRDDNVSAENWLQNIAIREAMDRLNEREQRILNLRFFQGRTQMEVAGEIGISQAQVSRLEKAALSHMRKLV